MSNGIFEVNFKSSMQDFGSGLIVIKDGSVNGGDAHFLYRGTIDESGKNALVMINVDKWRAGNTSIVNIDNFQIIFTGSIDFTAGSLNLSGHVSGQPATVITVSGRKIGDAA
jgi:hypothetical protein